MTLQDAHRPRILVVDDEPASRELVEIILGEEGCETVGVADAAQALARLDGSFDVVVSDLQMPGMDGLALTEELRRRHPDIEVLILTAFGSQERAHEAGRLQADYLRKPFDRTDLLHRVARLVEKARLSREVQELKAALRGRLAASTIIGDSRVIRAMLEQIAATARTDYPVVILGESGTGKELVAQAIHQASHRARGPFVAVNCGAIPPTLFESEIFGHARGAFTGAVATRAGVFEQASGGTLFLDEIGETAIEQQVKLLRVLQSGEVKRVGDSRSIHVNVRAVFATNRDLMQMVQEGTFRQDLYYRINVIPIRLPALRERREDIPVLASHFLARANAALARPVPGFSPSAIEKLSGYSWPGNVRELENKVKQAALLASGREIRAEDIILESGPAVPGSSLVDLSLPYEAARERFERAYLVECLKQHRGQITKAAEAMQMHRNSLYHLLKKYELDPAEYR